MTERPVICITETIPRNVPLPGQLMDLHNIVDVMLDWKSEREIKTARAPDHVVNTRDHTRNKHS